VKVRRPSKSIEPALKVLVAGSIDWDDQITIRSSLSIFPKTSKIVHTGSRGACALVDLEVRRLGFGRVEVVLARFQEYGIDAPMWRNIEIVDLIRPDFAVIFLMSRNPSLDDLIARLEPANIPAWIVD